MKRKIVQQGPATLMVSLPSKWAKKYNVRKGNEVDIIEEGPALTINAEGKTEPERVRIHIKDVKRFPDRMIHVPFRQGYDELIVEFDDPKAMPAIEKKLERLLGFEIVEQSEKSCTIKSFTQVEDNNIDQLKRRIFLLLLSFARDTADALSKNETSRLKPMISIETTLEKFAMFSFRLINKDKSSSPRELTFNFATVWMLEQASDNIARMCNHIVDNKVRLKRETILLYQQIVKAIDQFYHSYYDRDIDEIVKTRESLFATWKTAVALLEKDDAETVFYMCNVVERMIELSYLFV